MEESDSETVRGFSESGTDTESIASSKSTDRNRKKKEKKKASKQKRATEVASAAPAASAGASSSADDVPGVVVEYVSSVMSDADPALAEFASVFGKFAKAEELVSGKGKAAGEGEGGEGEGAAAAALAKAKAAAAAAAEEEEEAAQELSRRAKKRIKRLSIAELKQLVTKPEVVEAWDVTSEDPRLLVHLKSYRNTIPVPKHWCQKRKFLMGKRGMEKPPFQVRQSPSWSVLKHIHLCASHPCRPPLALVACYIGQAGAWLARPIHAALGRWPPSSDLTVVPSLLPFACLARRLTPLSPSVLPPSLRSCPSSSRRLASRRSVRRCSRRRTPRSSRAR